MNPFYNILEKTKQQRQRRDQWFPGNREMGQSMWEEVAIQGGSMRKFSYGDGTVAYCGCGSIVT